MLAGVRAIAAALAIVSVSFVAAFAQIVPPSDLPGRERFRFEATHADRIVSQLEQAGIPVFRHE